MGVWVCKREVRKNTGSGSDIKKGVKKKAALNKRKSRIMDVG